METKQSIKPVLTDLQDLYKRTFPAVARVIKKYGGNLEDAKDVFHDALLTWLEMTEERRSEVENETAYLCTIARNTWFRRVEKMDELKEATLIPEEVNFKVSAELYNLLVTAGKKCMDLLQAFYYEKRPAEQIARSLGLSGAHSASVQKHKCLAKLRHLAKARNHRKEDFYEN
jgi:RNA polymerase sigma factor (sigma-70 family)